MRKQFLLSAKYCAWVILLVALTSHVRAQFSQGSGATLVNADGAAQPASWSNSSAVTSESALPDPPEPSLAGRERPFTPPDMQVHYGKFSRMGVGSSISLLGIGVKGAVILAERLDGRVEGDFFFHTTGRFEVEGFNVNANFHLDTLSAKLDWYPTNSVWRITPGVMLFNGNSLSANILITGGTSFSMNGTSYYSATANPATGATPVSGKVAIGPTPRKPAFTISGGFGKVIPRSRRHWSFPSEFGVAFSGSPTVDVNLAGWVCTDRQQTKCSNVADPSNPVGMQFNQNFQSALARWRRDAGEVSIYPIFSGGVMYSFDMP